MKHLVILLLFFGFYPLVYCQTGPQKLKLLELISSIENEYDVFKVSPTSSFFIRSSGMIVERDTADNFELSFSLLDIDLTKAELLNNSTLTVQSLSFYCKNNEQCIHVKDGKKKSRYYPSFEVYNVKFENKFQSDSIVLKFNTLQKLLHK